MIQYLITVTQLKGIKNINLSYDDKYFSINNLKSSLQRNSDGLSSYFLKSRINYITFPIHFLFNLSISSGTYPNY